VFFLQPYRSISLQPNPDKQESEVATHDSRLSPRSYFVIVFNFFAILARIRRISEADFTTKSLNNLIQRRCGLRKNILLILSAMFMILPFSHICAGGDEQAEKSGPIQIVSDRLDAYNKKRLVVFSGNVVATQEDKIIKSDSLFLYYKKKEGESEKTGGPAGIVKPGEIDKIEAEGNVRMTQGKRIVTGEKAIFYNDEQKIVVTGNTVMQDGDNIIKGEKTVVFIKENRGVVESGPTGRVRATIYPKETKNGALHLKESN